MKARLQDMRRGFNTTGRHIRRFALQVLSEVTPVPAHQAYAGWVCVGEHPPAVDLFLIDPVGSLAALATRRVHSIPRVELTPAQIETLGL